RLHVPVTGLAGLHARGGVRLALPAGKTLRLGLSTARAADPVGLPLGPAQAAPQEARRAVGPGHLPSEGDARRGAAGRTVPAARRPRAIQLDPGVDQRLGVRPEHRVGEKVLSLFRAPGPGGPEPGSEEVCGLGGAARRSVAQRERSRLSEEPEHLPERPLHPRKVLLQRAAQRPPAVLLEHSGGGAALGPEQPGGEAEGLAARRRHLGQGLRPCRSLLEACLETISGGVHRSRRGTRPGGGGGPTPWSPCPAPSLRRCLALRWTGRCARAPGGRRGRRSRRAEPTTPRERDWRSSWATRAPRRWPAARAPRGCSARTGSSGLR